MMSLAICVHMQTLQQQVLVKERLQPYSNFNQIFIEQNSKEFQILCRKYIQNLHLLPYATHKTEQADCTCPCALDPSSQSSPGSCALARSPGLQWPADCHPLCSQDHSGSASSGQPGRQVTETFACLHVCQSTFPACLPAVCMFSLQAVAARLSIN